MAKRVKRSYLVSALMCIPLLTVLGCASGTASTGNAATGAAVAAGFPLKVSTSAGDVSIRQRPKAIVSLSPTATEMLYAIGAGNQVKAVDQYSDYPHGTPMTSLDGDNPNVESIVTYRPDLVVISDTTAGLATQLAKLHIPVIYDPAAATLSQAYAQIVGLGEATGHISEAQAEVSKIKAQISTIVSSVSNPARPRTYYYELDQTYYSVASSTFIGQVLGLLGLKSIADAAPGAATSGGYPQLNAEFIIKQNPNYIFLADTLCCGQSSATIAARPGWSVLSAVQHQRILGLNDDIASRWGPRVVVLLRQVASEIAQHPVPSGQA